MASAGKSETARVAAAVALLDRAYGRPAVAIDAELEARLAVEKARNVYDDAQPD